MSSPLAHSPTLPGDRPCKERLSCGTCDKTFVHLKTRHTHLLRYNHDLKENVEVSVPFFLHLRLQTIKCPVCSFKAKQVKSPRSFQTHFNRHGSSYTLQMAYTCSVCAEVMTSDDVQQHLDMHRSNRLALTPTATKPRSHDSPEPSSSSSSTVDTSSTSSSPPSSLPLSTPPPKSPESVESQTLPDTQNPMSPLAPSPPSFSPPPETNEALVRRFLDTCGNTPAPTDPASPSNPTTPSPAIPPLMANIISTPSLDVSQTRQPSPPANTPAVIPPLMSTTTTTPTNAVPPNRYDLLLPAPELLISLTSHHLP